MKKNISALLLLISVSLNAQVQDRLWVIFGSSFTKGAYSGVSTAYRADTYSLIALPTFKMESTNPKGTSFSIDMTIAGAGIFKFAGETDSSFYRIFDYPRYKHSFYKLKGNENAKTRFGIGWGWNWRVFGIGEQTGFHQGAPANSFYPGPLTAKGRFGLGINFHLVHTFTKNLYSRFSLHIEGEPGKILGATAYPEETLIFNMGQFAIIGTAAYRYSMLWGNPNSAEVVAPKRSATATAFIGSIGIAFDLSKYASPKR